MTWTNEEQTQTITQYNRMMYMRAYRERIKKNEYKNEIIWIKKSSIINPSKGVLPPSSS